MSSKSYLRVALFILLVFIVVATPMGPILLLQFETQMLLLPLLTKLGLLPAPPRVDLHLSPEQLQYVSLHAISYIDQK